MKRKLSMILCLLLVCCLLPLGALADWAPGKVVYITSKSAVNVYRSPSRTGYICEITSNGAYAYLGKSGDWYQIQLDGDTVGYVPTKYSAVANGYVWLDAVGDIDAVVLNTHYNALNVRKDSHIKAGVIGSMQPGELLPYCGEDSGWFRVLYEGRTGYVAGNRSAVITGSLTGEGSVDATSGATN